MYGQGNAGCALCGSQAAKFCLCRETVTLLCLNCIPIHEYHLHNEMHDLNAIDHLQMLYTLGNIQAFRMQKQQLMLGSTLIHRLEEVEMQQYLSAKQRIETVTQQYKQWLDYLHQSFQALLQRFNYEKTVPMTTTVFQLSKFSFCIYGFGDARWPQDGKLVELDPLNTFESQVAAMQVHLHQNCGSNCDFEEYYIGKINTGLNPEPVVPVQDAPVYYQNPAPEPVAPSRQNLAIVPKPFALYVPFSRSRLLAKWDTRTTNLDKVVLGRALNLTNLTVAVVLPDGNLAYVGGKDDAENRAVLVDTTDGQVTKLQDLLSGRSNPGLVYVDNMLYVFGGFQSGGITKLDTGEKFSFQTQNWTMIRGKMSTVRYQFSPCEFDHKIYLAGGWDTTAVDSFDLRSEAFTKLSLTLPKAFGTTCFGFNGELIVLQDHRLLRWKIASNNTQTVNIDQSVKDSNVCPQVFGTKAYISRETDNVCEVLEVDLQTWTLKKVASLSSGGGNPQCPVS